MSAPGIAPTVPLNDGNRIPVIGLGTYKGNIVDNDEVVPGYSDSLVEQAVKDALDAGCRHIDTALLYGSEGAVGRAVKAKIAEGLVKREDLFITTKLWNNAHRPDLVEPTFRQSLANLGMDYANLYLMHWPQAFAEGGSFMPIGADGKLLLSYVDILDTWRAMEALVRKGLVKSIGVSNFNSVQLKRLMDNCSIKPVVNQVECHPYLNQKKLIAFCQQHDIRVEAYSPFGSPDSSWSAGSRERILEDPTIGSIARNHNKSAAQIVLRYLVQNNAIPVPKSVIKSEIQENFAIFDFELTDKDMETLDGINRNRRFCQQLIAKDHPEYPFSIEF